MTETIAQTKPRRRGYRRSRSSVSEAERLYAPRRSSIERRAANNNRLSVLPSPSPSMPDRLEITPEQQVGLGRSFSEHDVKDKKRKDKNGKDKLRKPPRRCESYCDDISERKRPETSLEDLIRASIEHDREQSKGRWGDSKDAAGLQDSGTLPTVTDDSDPPESPKDIKGFPSIEGLSSSSSHDPVIPKNPLSRRRSTVRAIKEYVARSDDNNSTVNKTLSNNDTTELDVSRGQSKEQGKTTITTSTTSRARKSYNRIKKTISKFGRQDSNRDDQQQASNKQDDEQSAVEVKETNQTLTKSAKKNVRKVVNSIIGFRRKLGSNESSDKSQEPSTAPQEIQPGVGSSHKSQATGGETTGSTCSTSLHHQKEETMEEADDIYVEEEDDTVADDGETTYHTYHTSDLTYQGDLESYQMSTHSVSVSTRRREETPLLSFAQKDLLGSKLLEPQELQQTELEKLWSSCSSLQSDLTNSTPNNEWRGPRRCSSSRQYGGTSNAERLSSRRHVKDQAKPSALQRRRSSSRETTSARRESRRESRRELRREDDENIVQRRKSSREGSRENRRMSSRSRGGDKQRMTGSGRSHGRRHRSSRNHEASRNHEHRFTRKSHGMWRCRCGAYENGHKVGSLTATSGSSPPRSSVGGGCILADGSDVDRRERKFERSSSNVSSLDNGSVKRDLNSATHRKKSRRSSNRLLLNTSANTSERRSDRSRRRRRTSTRIGSSGGGGDEGGADRRLRRTSSRDQSKHRGNRRNSSEDVQEEEVVVVDDNESIDMEYQSVALKSIESSDDGMEFQSTPKSGEGIGVKNFGIWSSERSSTASSVDERWRVSIDRSGNEPPSRYESVHDRKKDDSKRGTEIYRTIDDDYESSLSDSDSSVESLDVSEQSGDLDRRRNRIKKRVEAHQSLRRHSFGSEHERACKDRLMDILRAQDL